MSAEDEPLKAARRTPEETAIDAEGKPVPPPQKQRPKMSLDQQSDFLLDLLARCKMHGPELRGRFAGDAILTLSTDDMLRLETIQQTLFIFDQNEAAALVKQAMWRKMKERRGQ